MRDNIFKLKPKKIISYILYAAVFISYSAVIAAIVFGVLFFQKKENDRMERISKNEQNLPVLDKDGLFYFTVRKKEEKVPDIIKIPEKTPDPGKLKGGAARGNKKQISIMP